MTKEQKIQIIEDMLMVDEGTIEEEMQLSDIEEWDSMAIMSFVAVLDSNFNKTVTASEIKKCSSIKDVLALME